MRWALGICAAGVACIAIPLGAQTASLRGLVLTEATERPIAGVVVSIERLKLSATTDSLGRFTLMGIPAGAHLISARRVGFGPIDSPVSFTAGATVEADLLLTPTAAQALPVVSVETKAPARGKLIEFEQRRSEGFGRYLTQADLEKRAFSTLTDALRQMPGIEFLRNRDRAYEYYAVAGRMSQPAGAMAGGGKLLPCFAAVVLDGMMVYGAGESDEPKFNVASINPTTLGGIEFYVGPATIPAKYNGLRHTCGLLLLWTK